MTHSILIVDDDPDDVEITKLMLSAMRHDLKVTAVSRGEAAIELLSGSADLPSLILLDIKMPGIGGIETLREIRSDDRLKHVPVVIVTNSSLEADKKESFNAGADGFLHKAFDMDQFSKDMNSLLGCYLRN